MHWSGIIIGIIAFLIIGLFHPIVIRIWPVFLILGLICCISSLFLSQIILSGSLAVLGCAMLWSVIELKEQAERVRKGWFPANPKHIKKEHDKKE
ncbi:DUF4491 family protein [Kineothrix sedimenti]|uniref:DUF4491 family protein n=1 Tax=Kineothrix sedimenti TaxID=3123317 RepID=A0ABZ3ET08_9FIRM